MASQRQDDVLLVGGSAGIDNPITIDDGDDDNDVVYIARRARQFEEETRAGQEILRRIEEVLEDGVAEVIDLTGDGNRVVPSRAASVRPLASVEDEERELNSFLLSDGSEVRPGLTVELEIPIGKFNSTFVRVKTIVQPRSSSEVEIRGLGLTRIRELEGLLSTNEKRNELVVVEEVRPFSPDHWERQGLVSVSPSQIEKLRRMRMTNAPFPQHRFNPDLKKKGRAWLEEHGLLVCRHWYRLLYNSSKRDRPTEHVLRNLTEKEADGDYTASDSIKLIQWRGGRTPGGSHIPGQTGPPVIDLEATASDPPASPPRRVPGQKYTAGDLFCGAGGASRGITRAGLQLVFAVDNWGHAVHTWKSNFPTLRIYHMDAEDFIAADHTSHTVDILHLSPPCQVWSPAHTVAGKNDEENMKALYTCAPLVAKHKPRVFTVEQTFGLTNPKFAAHFHQFLREFTDLGYSIRWGIISLENYGVPQTRKRLTIIGSAPGEALPPFPAPTHNERGTNGLKPWVTARAALDPAARHRDHPLNQPTRAATPPPRLPWNADGLVKTITTSGGMNYHWSGTRDFTRLEYALLQTFPTWHRFEGACVKRQIGNAFPPVVVRTLYEHLVDWLLEQDGFGRDARRAVPLDSVGPEDYINLEDGAADGDDGHDDDNDDEAVVVLSSRPSPAPRQQRNQHRRRVGSNPNNGAPVSGTTIAITAATARVHKRTRVPPASPALAPHRLSESVRLLNRAAKMEEDGDDHSMADSVTMGGSSRAQSLVNMRATSPKPVIKYEICALCP
ncbi:S-adenosyl-L-methionine-dependent methyltransferase [Dichotomopilus funicola]|uniref:DNA (cytosine-5-)-methyltransferase n=1 Tax=Dichotomopilus funicola TaxID=1934379 RepID=A0AAN6ZPM5_9PEZI|nr:S-adenosyl-L-methionine-dependent methyltransferase [Dichotomopilus funicola]